MSHFLFFFLSLNFLVVISRIPTSTSTSHLSLPPVPSLCGLFVWRKLSRLWHFPVSRVTSASCIPPICLELGSLALLQAPFGPGLGNLQGGRDHPRKTRPPGARSLLFPHISKLVDHLNRQGLIVLWPACLLKTDKTRKLGRR